MGGKKGDIFIVSHEPDNLSVQEKHTEIYTQSNNGQHLKGTDDCYRQQCSWISNIMLSEKSILCGCIDIKF